MSNPDWKKMYVALVDCVERALTALPKSMETELSRRYLIKGLQKAEDIYLASTETNGGEENEA